VGGLDVDTTGLLLLADDGTFIHAWSSGKRRIPKRSAVVTRHPVDDAMAATLLDGVLLRYEHAPVGAAGYQGRSECALEMVVTEGKDHQVRRMVAAAGNRVEALHRSAIGGLELPAGLPVGEWRWLGDADLQQLQNYTATPMPIE